MVEFIDLFLIDLFRQCYNKHKSICPGDSYDRGELVAVKSRSQWHRGRFLQYKPNIDFAQVRIYFDLNKYILIDLVRYFLLIMVIHVHFLFK
jgi:hypothetical protein